MRVLYTEFAPKLADVLASGEAPDGRELTFVEPAARGYTHLDGDRFLTLVRDMVLPDWSNPTKRIWPPYNIAPDPEEDRLDLEAWRVAERHVQQENYAAWQRQEERRQAQQAQDRAKARNGGASAEQ